VNTLYFLAERWPFFLNTLFMLKNGFPQYFGDFILVDGPRKGLSFYKA
jgi:hypothetical protein